MLASSRTRLDRELNQLRDDIVRLASMVEDAITTSMDALYRRDLALAQQVISNDEQLNQLRYDIEQLCLQVLATQQPAASDLRTVLANLHIASELERMGDHAAGVASVVLRMEEEDAVESLHKLPKMAARVLQMISEVTRAYVEHNEALAFEIIEMDAKVDKHYRKLFRKTLVEINAENYAQRATYLMWVGHNLERIGDRVTNIAERVIFMISGHNINVDSYTPDMLYDDDDDSDEEFD